jgi:hypothetical protein
VDGSGCEFHPVSTAAILRFYGFGGRPIYEPYFRKLAVQPASSFLLTFPVLQSATAF